MIKYLLQIPNYCLRYVPMYRDCKIKIICYSITFLLNILMCTYIIIMVRCLLKYVIQQKLIYYKYHIISLYHVKLRKLDLVLIFERYLFSILSMYVIYIYI